MTTVLPFKIAVKSSSRFLFALVTLVGLAGGLCSAKAASAYGIIDAQTGAVLQSQEPRQKRQIGSVTKIATAMVVLDWAEKKGGNLAAVATIPPEAFVGTTENNIGFQPGDTVELRDLMYAALVQSDNIAPYTLANHVGSTLQSLVPAASKKGTPVSVFVSQMNALAIQLRMEKTRFSNPHGIDQNVKPMPYSSAEDVARLTRYAMNRASFRFYVSQKERQISFQRGNRKMNYLLRNTNELLGTHGIDGVKTGRTTRAGDCLVLSAVRDPQLVWMNADQAKVYPRRIIVVLLGSTNRFGEGEALVEKGWQLFDQWAAAGRPIDPKKQI